MQDNAPIIVAIFVVVTVLGFIIPIPLLRERRLGQQLAYLTVYAMLEGVLLTLVFEWPSHVGIAIVVLLGLAFGYLVFKNRVRS